MAGCIGKAESGTVNPYPFELEKKDGSNKYSTSLFYHGSSPFDSVIADTDGYTVIQDKRTSNFVYAKKNDTSGELMSSGIAVGDGDPKTAGIAKKLVSDSFSEDHTTRHLLEGHQEHHRELASPSTGTLKNLVILVRFQDHNTRILPTVEDFEIMFNHKGEDNDHHDLAPTGSVRDVFRVNSYGKLILESEIYGWVDLPEPESYYAAGKSGFATPEYQEALHSAMDALRDDFNIFDFSQFDGNNDGKIDMVTLVHSGFAAEFNGADEDGTENSDRIWSHHRKLQRKHRWHPDPNNKNTEAYVYQYGTVPALYGAKGSEIGRIGVTCHEIGHAIGKDGNRRVLGNRHSQVVFSFLLTRCSLLLYVSFSGLPDLYGTSQGNGIGSYDFMSNHWGFPPYFYLSQLYPPILSPWTKIQAGWLDPIVIDKSGTFDITASQLSDQIYKINMDDEGIEYLLIENRQAIGFDSFLPQGGLAIWHIDEEASNVEGYPGQEGFLWPLNKKHYRVSLLQADGNYDLEQRKNNGDKFDLFHGDGVDFLGSSVNFVDGPYPSTDSYRNTVPVRTGILIDKISKSDISMTFSVKMMKELSSAFIGGNGASGTMFDVLPAKDIQIQKIYLNLAKEKSINVELWTRTGTHVSYENQPWLWQRQAVVLVEGNGKGRRSSMDVGGLVFNANTLYGFYIVVTRGKFRYTSGMGVGNVAISNDDLTIYEGAGLARPFGTVYKNRIWNGEVFYEVISQENTGRRLETTFDGGSGQSGIMFDVFPKDNLTVKGFDLHLFDANETNVRMYTKEKSFAGSENTPEDWTLVVNKNVTGKGSNSATKIALDEETALHLSKERLQGFYIVVGNGSGLRYTNGSGTSNLTSSNEDLAIFEGVGVASEFGSTFSNRIWNGAFHYETESA